MKRIAASAMLFICLGQAGCSVCCTPWDYAYGGYGGLTPRENRYYGRVGSAFEPVGAMPGLIRPYGYEQTPPEPEKMEEAAPDESKSL